MASDDRLEQLRRNGRWGTCVDCPRDAQGRAYPERCEHTARSDHQLTSEGWELTRAHERAVAAERRAARLEAALRALVAGEPCACDACRDARALLEERDRG